MKRVRQNADRITGLKKSINDLMELKNTAQELCEAYTSFRAELINQKKGYQRLKTNSMK